MALEPLSAQELAASPTLFASFMDETDGSYRTVGELLELHRRRGRIRRAATDPVDHVRVERFMEDMASSRWDEDLVMRIGVFDDTVLVIDGIHRGIAYLGCLEEGISPERLPALQVNR